MDAAPTTAPTTTAATMATTSGFSTSSTGPAAGVLPVALPEEKSYKDREAELLSELAALYTKLNQVRDKRAKAEQETAANHGDDNASADADGRRGGGRRRRVLLVTRTLPFTLIADEAQSQWRAEFPENVSLDAAMETYLCLHETHDCVWVGSVHGEIEPSEQHTLREQLLQDRNYYPVFLDPKRERLFYQGFCKTVLWPLFHSCPPTTEDQLITHEVDHQDGDERNMEKMWQAYVSVNQAFADAVQEIYEEGDLVWIQGYHLTLVPQMLQSLFPNDNIHIGYFMHIPFPSSELYRIMNNREEILTGMLGADLIGFQTYEYARHFQSSAVRLLGLESSHKGVDYNGHFARVTICPVGIDADKFSSLARSDAVAEQIRQLKGQFAGKKVILGVDQLDLTKGLVHKLLAVEELFTLRPELSGEVVFVQIVTGAAHLFDSPLGAQVESLVSRINSKLQDVGADAPVQYLNQEIPVDTLIALYALADAIVITPVRDGMNTMPFEYVVCREAVGRHARVVLSEFAGCAHSLGGALLVNPWNTEELQVALLKALEESEEVLRAHQTMYSYVSTFTSKHWADNFLEQLEECSEENALAVSGRELSRRDMTSAYIRSSRRLIFINYEGVLAAEASIPELSYPPQELIWQLMMLTKDPRNTVVLVSARSTAVCEQWFATLSGSIVLAAEYGVYVKWVGEHETWRCMVPNLDLSWWEHVVPLLEYYTERTPGAFIERKDSSVAWHYRDCDLDHGLWQASELLISLREITRSLPVAVVPGNRYLEVRPQKVSKASLFERIWEYLNYTSLFPDEEPVDTDYFGDTVKPMTSPLIKPSVAIDLSERWRSKDRDELGKFRLQDLEDGDAPGGENRQDESKPVRFLSDETSFAEDGDDERFREDGQTVDFVLVIASGDDRTDEDLFSVLVPPPIDLEAYCKQLEKDQLMRRLSDPAFFSNDEDFAGSEFRSSLSTAPTSSLMRRRSWTSNGEDTNSSLSASIDESGPSAPRTSPKAAFRRLLSREAIINPSTSMDHSSDHLLPPPLSHLPSQGAEAEFLLLGENITKLPTLYGHSALSKPAISDDAATMFPRTLLTTPATARRDEITEKSKFTPRRDFPPSVALFKAMKTKYGDSFGMHKLPDTPAACWALVCPPNARAKLEDQTLVGLATGQAVDRKTSTGSNPSLPKMEAPDVDLRREASDALSAEGLVLDSLIEDSSPTASLADINENVHGGMDASINAGPGRLEPDASAEESEETRYLFPVNTFVCTLGRKLSQAPYYIKNSADLFQLLQEMGLSSHLRRQRQLSLSGHANGGSPVGTGSGEVFGGDDGDAYEEEEDDEDDEDEGYFDEDM